MPSRLIPTNPTFQEKDRARAQAQATLQTLGTHGPWLGYTPDLPSVGLDLSSAKKMFGLEARSLPQSHGEVLMTLPGWQKVSNDGADLPIGGAADNSVIMLAEFPRTEDYDTKEGEQSGEFTNTLLAWVGGDGVGLLAGTENSAELWRVLPSTEVWERIAHTNVGPGTTDRPGGGRDAIPDFAVFSAGASARTAFSGNVTEPVFIITNNVDPVYIFPGDDGTHTFEDLTDDPALDPFKAQSCEVFNNRVYFLNTMEATNRYRQRLRRTPPFTCDPKISAVGAGSLDLKDFSGAGLRLLRLGTVMVAYFEDGVAFIRATGNYTAPDAVQTVSTSRGLISTHSIVNIGNDLHFGIFTDGWFYLDPSGRFQEVGMKDVGGAAQGKWKDTFYSILSKEPVMRGRLYCQYDQAANQILISIPTGSQPTTDENSTVWVYDIQSDRVWPDSYEALCFGAYSRQLSGAPTYASTTKTYITIGSATYASLEARFGLKAVAHGTSNGYVFQHEPEFYDRAEEAASGTSPVTWSYTSHHLHSESPRNLLTVDRLLIEHIGLFNTSALTFTLTDGTLGSAQTSTASLLTGTDGQTIATSGDIAISGTFDRYSGRNLDLQFSGSGAFMLRAIEADIFDEQVEVFA
jgi:hypothetical protein